MEVAAYQTTILGKRIKKKKRTVEIGLVERVGNIEGVLKVEESEEVLYLISRKKKILSSIY